MHNRPTHVTDADVLEVLRTWFDTSVTRVEHVAVGFGAWHWRADAPDGPVLFVTLDPPTPRHDAGSFEATYAAAARLGLDLPFVHAPVTTAAGRHTVDLGGDVLSATRWVPGQRPGRFGPEAADLVRRLHAAAPPTGLRTWTPLVDADLTERLHDWTSSSWLSGPLGEEARAAIRERSTEIGVWLADYLDLCAGLDPATYVPTHGEPGVHNQWLTETGLLIIDWESLLLAPAERDLLAPEAADLVEHDPDRRRLFDLEWRLAEIDAYAQWLRGEHQDTEDVRTALSGLRHELTRA